VQAIGQGLGALYRLLDRLGPHSLDPHAHPPYRKILLCLMNFCIGL
jgi:hypothetical protein